MSRGKNSTAKGRTRLIILNFIRAMLILAFIGAIVNERWLVLFVSAAALIVTFLPSILESRFRIKIPAEFEIMTLLFIYGSLFFGEVRGFYAMFWWWDLLLNFAASLALGFVGLTIMYVLYRDDRVDASPMIIAIFAFAFSLAMGTVWEIGEFALDYLFNFHLQSASLQDTMGDLVVNALGAFLVSAGGYFYIKSGKINLISTVLTNFIELNPSIFRSPKEQSSSEKILSLIKKGESSSIEFKETLRTNVHTKQHDKKIEHSAIKTIAAYLNSSGGKLLVGVDNNGRITGIEKDNFQNLDRCGLHLTNLIKEHIGSEFLPFIRSEMTTIEGKTIILIECTKSTKPVFLNWEGQEEFYVRNGASSSRLSGSSLLDYVETRFKRN